LQLPKYIPSPFRPASLHLPSLFLCSTFVTVRFFVLCGVLNPKPNPQPGGPGYPFLSGSSPLTCLAREALPIAYTTSIALRITWPHKPHHYVKIGSPSGGGGLDGTWYFYIQGTRNQARCSFLLECMILEGEIHSKRRQLLVLWNCVTSQKTPLLNRKAKTAEFFLYSVSWSSSYASHFAVLLSQGLPL